MSWVEIVGYVASGLVLTTFYMKTMVPLRYCAIASNGAFIAYGFFAAIYPVLVLHLLLLPLNVKRLLEIRQMIKDDHARVHRRFLVRGDDPLHDEANLPSRPRALPPGRHGHRISTSSARAPCGYPRSP